MFFPTNGGIWFYPTPVDFRKQIDGLVMMVADHLALNPTMGQMFIFRSKGTNKIKILWWDRNGFWLLYKRLEKGKFVFPPIKNDALELSSDQLSWLLSGLNCLSHPQLPKVCAKNFY